MESNQPAIESEFGEQPVEEVTPPAASVSENRTDDEVITLTPELERDLAAEIDSNWETADAGRVDWMRQKEEGLRLYWGITTKKEFPFKGCANLHVPLIR